MTVYTFLVKRLLTVREDNSVFTLSIPEQCEVFATKFDDLQRSISKVSISNKMLAGMYACSYSYTHDITVTHFLL